MAKYIKKDGMFILSQEEEIINQKIQEQQSQIDELILLLGDLMLGGIE